MVYILVVMRTLPLEKTLFRSEVFCGCGCLLRERERKKKRERERERDR